jgi:hypothetical protein
MASDYADDLDRAYVINGDDLRIALSGNEGRPPIVASPRDVAAYVIATIGRPLDDVKTDLKRAELAQALAKVRVTIEEPEVSNSVHGSDHGWQPLSATGAVKRPDELAGELVSLMEAKSADSEPGRAAVGVPMTREQLAKAIEHLRESSGKEILVSLGPSALARELFLVVRDRWPEHGGDAHICCGHYDGPGPFSDPEVVALATAVGALEANDWRTALRALWSLPKPARARAIDWLTDRYPSLDDLPF